MITSSEIELCRSPADLREFVNKLKQAVQADESERHRGIQKKGLYKEFLDELIPLSCFALLAYPDNYKVQLILGNQGYDAKVFDETGKEVDRIEITIPHNGAAEAKDARLIVDRGYGQIVMSDTGTDFAAMFQYVRDTCRKKAQKDYGNYTLVVAIELMPPFQSFKLQYEQKIKELVSEMAQIKFNAKRVFLLVIPDRVIDVNS